MKPGDLLALALIGAALAVPAPEFAARWLALPQGDMGQHLINAMMTAVELREGNPLHLLFWNEAAAYPQVGYVVPFLLGARGIVALCASQAFWIFLACVGTYALGVQLWNRGTGLVAALLVAFSPPVLSLLRTFLLDLPSMATVICALAAMAASEGFTRRGWSLAAGALIGLVLLTKWTGMFFLAPPLAWLAWRSWKWLLPLLVLFGAALAVRPFDSAPLWIPVREGTWWMLGFVLVGSVFARGPLVVQALALATVIAGPFYVWNMPMMLSRVEAERQFTSAMTLAEVLGSLGGASAFFPTSGMVVLAGLVMVLARGPLERRLYVAAPLLFGCGLLFLLNLGWTRYLMPGVPLMALAMVGWLPWWALLAAGLWNGWIWVSGGLRPVGGDVLVARVPGCGPGSLNAWARDLLAGLPEGFVLMELQTPLLKTEMMQAWAMDAGRVVIVKGVHAPGQGALRYAAVRRPPEREARVVVDSSLQVSSD